MACTEYKPVLRAVVVVAVVFSLYFAKVYFYDYPRNYADWFDAGIQIRAKNARATGAWDLFLKTEKPTQWRPVLQYYSILYEGDSCESSAQRIALQ
jgi:hypothetical protein